MTKPEKKYNRLIDVVRKGYNNQTRDELLMVRYFSVKTAIKELARCLADTTRNGKRIRKERQTSMLKVLEVLYTYLYKSKTGQVNPSMRTLAFLVNPELKKPHRHDTELEIKMKERAIHATEMSVQRAIKTLQEIGMITVHQYYVDNEHFLSKKNACFFYELTPLSHYSRLYLDTREDKNGRRIESTNTIVFVPGRSTSDRIITPKGVDIKEERRLRREARLRKRQLEKDIAEDLAFEEKLLFACRNPKAKKLGTLSQVLEAVKNQPNTIKRCKNE